MLYLHHVDQIGGAEKSLLLLFRHLLRDRVTPLFAGPATGPFPSALVQYGIPLYAVPFTPLRNLPGVIRSVRRVLELIREHRIDLLHSNGPQTNICAGLAGLMAGIPVVWHARNLLYHRMRDVDRMFAWLATRIVCNSDAIRARFQGSGAWPKSVSILNAVDPGEFHPEVPREPFRREWGISPSDTAVGIVGRIGLGKGHEVFVDAAARLLGADLPARFFIIGDSLFPEDVGRKEMLERRIKEAGVGERLQLTGFRKDIPSVMRGLDILVLASEAEPCGRVLFEAMASGTAVVATNTGGTPEIVRHEQEGLLVPPGEAPACADAIGRLIRGPSLRRALGRAGAERSRAVFGMERYVRETMRVYDDAVQDR